MTVIYDLTDDINEDEWTVRACFLVVLNLLQTDNVRVDMGSSGWSGRAFGGRLGGRCWVAWGRFQLRLCTRPESWQNCRNALSRHFFSVSRFTNPLLYKCLDMALKLGGSPLYQQGQRSDCLNCALSYLIFHPSIKPSWLGAPLWAYKENHVSKKSPKFTCYCKIQTFRCGFTGNSFSHITVSTWQPT